MSHAGRESHQGTSRTTGAARASDIILRGFEDFHQGFRSITRRSIERFEQRDWDGIQRDSVRRLGLHQRNVDATLEELDAEFAKVVKRRSFWADLKDAYSLAILGRDDSELARTFFNSLTRRVFSHDGIDAQIDFLAADYALPFRGWEMASTRTYSVRQVTPVVMRKVLLDAGFRSPFEDLDRDSQAAAEAISGKIDAELGASGPESLDFLRPLFIRNKAAYLIGRARRGKHTIPIVLPLLNLSSGLALDAIITSEDEVSILFSFARWYFHADLASPREAIGFLNALLPRKRISELYIALGYNKHGKTEFYRDLTQVIDSTNEQFVHAPGQRGMVMAVFTLPSYEFVFKIIRDRFPAFKGTTRQRIRDKYRLVLLHDRVGRLVDFQEFEFLKFARRRFSPSLLEELLAETSLAVEPDGDAIVLRHLYVGRRVTPLDLYLETADEEACRRAVIDWGYAIKDLAAANIFAGDMLLKNFGVTRHGRVVFYDYDELCALNDCRFRSFPQPRTEEEALSAEPWYTVAETDVFPEELANFIGLTGSLLDVFLAHHGDLFEPGFWQRLQERLRSGEVIDFFPYAASQRRLRIEGEQAPASPA